MLTYLILGMTYAFAAAVQPGPLQTYLISQTLSHGWRRTLPAAFCPLISDGPVIVLALLVLSRVPAWMAQGLRVAGGVFVLYLAWGAVKAWRGYTTHDTCAGAFEPAASGAGECAEPQPIYELEPGTGAAPAESLARDARARRSFAGGFYGTMVLSLAGTIVLFAAARDLGPRVTRVLIGLSSVALACFGCYLLWSGAGGLAAKAATL